MEEGIENKKNTLLKELDEYQDPQYTIFVGEGRKTYLNIGTRGSQYRGVSKNGKKWQV